ncbi:hypothetical protein GBAR_LOCUS30850, partial [Geodia barretti]
RVGGLFFARLSLLPNLGLAIRLVVPRRRIFSTRQRPRDTPCLSCPHCCYYCAGVATVKSLGFWSWGHRIMIQGKLSALPSLPILIGVPDNSPSSSTCIPRPLASTSLLTVVAGPPLRSTTAL